MKEENLCLEEYLENINKIKENPNFFNSRIVILFRKQREQICEWNTKLILC